MNLWKEFCLRFMLILILYSILWTLFIIFCCRVLVFVLFSFFCHLNSCFIPLTLTVVFGREYFVNSHNFLSLLCRIIIVGSDKFIDIKSVFAAFDILKECLINSLFGIHIQNVVLSHETVRALSLLGIAAPWDRLRDWFRKIGISERRLYKFQTDFTSSIELIVWEEHRRILISSLRWLRVRRFASTNNGIGRLWESRSRHSRRTLVLSLL